MTGRRHRVIPLLIVLALTTAGCASRVSHDDVVRASGTIATSSAAPGSDTPEGAAQASEGSAGALGTPGQRAGTTGGGTSGTTGGPTGSATGTVSGSTGMGNRTTSGSPIVIGSAESYTGLGTAGLDQIRMALQAWAADLNSRGGIKGRSIRLIVRDDGGDAAKARAQVQEMVEKDKVVALVGNIGWSSSADAWQSYLEGKKIPAIGGNCAARGWNSSPVFFSQCPSLDTTFYGAVHLAAKYGSGKKFGAIVCTEDAACATAEDDWFTKGYARKAGLEPVYRARISLAQPDFTAQCIQAKSAGVEILGLGVDPATTKRIMASCNQQEFKPQYLLTYAEEAVDTLKYSDNIISAQMQFPFMGLRTPAYESFISVWNKYYKVAPTPMAATAWASAKIFERAARDATRITSQGLIEALYRYRNDRFGGLTIPLSYGPRGTRNAPCIFYMRGSQGRWSVPFGDKPVCW